jgi:glycosyltransferase involved in cell wall biosynthesis
MPLVRAASLPDREEAVTRPIRVCFVTEYFYPEVSGGSPKYLSELVWFLSQHFDDLEIDVITSRSYYRGSGPRPAAAEQWGRAAIRRVGSPRSNRPSMALRLLAGGVFALFVAARLVFGRRRDLIVVNTNPPAAPLAASLARRLRGTPYFYLVHDLYPDLPVRQRLLSSSGRAARIGRWLQRRWLRGAVAVSTLGRCCAAYLVAEYGLDPRKVHVIPSWEDPERIKPAPPEASVWRREFGLDGCVFLYAGNMGPFQNLDLLLDAAALVRDEPGIRFALVGSGVLREELARRAEREGLSNVRVLPAVPTAEYADLLSGSDVHIVALDLGLEGLAVPSKLYSCLASGRPVLTIAAPESELSRVVEESRCGVAASPRDAASVADACRQLAHDDAARKRMGQNAREAAVSRYSLDLVAPRYYGLLREVVEVRQG